LYVDEAPTPHHELNLDAPASQGRRTTVLLQKIIQAIAKISIAIVTMVGELAVWNHLVPS